MLLMFVLGIRNCPSHVGDEFLRRSCVVSVASILMRR